MCRTAVFSVKERRNILHHEKYARNSYNDQVGISQPVYWMCYGLNSWETGDQFEGVKQTFHSAHISSAAHPVSRGLLSSRVKRKMPEANSL